MRFFSIRPPSFNGLVRLGNGLQQPSSGTAVFHSEFLRPYCVAYLDQLLRNDDTLQYIRSEYPTVNRYLKQVGFDHLAPDSEISNPFPTENMIALTAFNGDLNDLAEEVPFWLEQQLFSRSFAPNFTPPLRRKIVKNLWEIVCNAIQHSDSVHGASCCGQFYPEKGYFEIAFYDHGLGIPQQLRRHFDKAKSWSDVECIAWALRKGTSTHPLRETRGMGLFYLRNFLTLNGGWLQVASGRGIYQSEGERVQAPVQIAERFQGTLFNLRIVYDDEMYSTVSERP